MGANQVGNILRFFGYNLRLLLYYFVLITKNNRSLRDQACICTRPGIILLSLKSSQKYHYFRRPIRDLLETHRRPTCVIGDPSQINMPDWRPISDQHATSETDMSDRRPILVGKTYISYGSPIRHVGLQWVSDEACRSTWVFAEACRSPMRHVGLR